MPPLDKGRTISKSLANSAPGASAPPPVIVAESIGARRRLAMAGAWPRSEERGHLGHPAAGMAHELRHPIGVLPDGGERLGLRYRAARELLRDLSPLPPHVRGLPVELGVGHLLAQEDAIE